MIPASPKESLSEEELDFCLMNRIAQGDMGAMEELIERHQKRVLGTVIKMLGNDAEAEDIAQQVFLRVWNSADTYTASAKFTTWLFKITRNLVFNEVRRRNRHPALALEQEMEEHHFQAEESRIARPDDSLLEAELQQAIQEAIESLPEIQRMAIVLRRYEELSYEEIAEILDLSLPAVKSTLFRARQELRAKLAKYLEP